MNNKQKLLTATAITGTIVSASAFTVFDYAICRRKKQPDVRKKEKWKPYLDYVLKEQEWLKEHQEQELKEKILELRKKNYPYDKIAMELGTNESRVKLIIGLLVEEGKLDSLATNLYKKETEEKLKQILSMAKAKRNVSEISSSLGISVDRTYLYLDRLVEEGRLSIAEVYQCADEEIEKRVIELRKAGLGQREIMKEMKITKQDTLRRILDKLFSEGKIDSYKKVDKTKKRIVELLKYGYNAEEISRQLVKDEQNIRSLMAELIRDGVITQDEITQAREAKKEEIIELIRQGKGRREIIQKIGIKYKDLGDFLREIIESGELKKNKESSKVNRRDLIEQDDGR